MCYSKSKGQPNVLHKLHGVTLCLLSYTESRGQPFALYKEHVTTLCVKLSEWDNIMFYAKSIGQPYAMGQA